MNGLNNLCKIVLFACSYFHHAQKLRTFYDKFDLEPARISLAIMISYKGSFSCKVKTESPSQHHTFYSDPTGEPRQCSVATML